MIPRLKQKYTKEVVSALEKQLDLSNVMRVPRFEKIVVNMGVGEGSVDSKQVDAAMEELALITGQKPRLNRAKKSFDGRGDYSFGVTEQLIFPELDYDKVTSIRGMDITICTTAETDEDARALLNAFGFPFRRQDAKV